MEHVTNAVICVENHPPAGGEGGGLGGGGEGGGGLGGGGATEYTRTGKT